VAWVVAAPVLAVRAGLAAGAQCPARAAAARVRHARAGPHRGSAFCLTLRGAQVLTLGPIVIREAAALAVRVVVRHIALKLVLAVVHLVHGYVLAARVGGEHLIVMARVGREACRAFALGAAREG